MKLIELFEESNDIAFSQALRIIKQECKPFLNTFDKPLYRGIADINDLNYLGPAFFEGKIRQDRIPRDMPEDVTDIFNVNFKELTGISNVRNKSLFCSFDENTAFGYDNDDLGSFMIFPVGNFDYIWSPIINDAYVECVEMFGQDGSHQLLDLFKSIAKERGYETLEFIPREDELSIVDQALGTPGVYLFNQGAESLQRSKHEVMILGTSFYAIQSRGLNSNTYAEIIDLLKE